MNEGTESEIIIHNNNPVKTLVIAQGVARLLVSPGETRTITITQPGEIFFMEIQCPK